jgi:hypothetical protein
VPGHPSRRYPYLYVPTQPVIQACPQATVMCSFLLYIAEKTHNLSYPIVVSMTRGSSTVTVRDLGFNQLYARNFLYLLLIGSCTRKIFQYEDVDFAKRKNAVDTSPNTFPIPSSVLPIPLSFSLSRIVISSSSVASVCHCGLQCALFPSCSKLTARPDCSRPIS